MLNALFLRKYLHFIFLLQPNTYLLQQVEINFLLKLIIKRVKEVTNIIYCCLFSLIRLRINVMHYQYCLQKKKVKRTVL
jgi:hypothetical protein